MKKLFKENQYLFYLLIISIIGYIWSLVFAPTFDFADEFFQRRYFMFEAIQNKIFPLWLPFQSMGIPIHADPQAGIFYIPLWIMSLFGEYQPIAWGIEVIFHAFFAGFGMYSLSRNFCRNRLAAFVIGAAYLLSGFFVANMQHLPWLIAGCWVPWVIKYVVDILEKPTLKNALLLALFASLLFTGGYPGFYFILFSLFMVLLICKIIICIKNKEYQYIKKISGYLLIAGVVTILLSLPFFISILEASQLITRGNGLSYSDANLSNFYPKSLLSLVFPLISCSDSAFTGTDISMGSIYIGFLSLFFCGVGLFQKKTTMMKVLLYWCLACFLISFGNFLPFHKWVFHAIPFFNLVHYATTFRIFTIIGLLLLATLGLDQVLSQFEKYRKALLYYLIISAVLFVGLLVILFITNPHSEQSFFQIFIQIKTLPLTYKFMKESFFHLIIIVLMIIPVIFRWKQSKSIIILLLIMDLILHAWVCTSFTGFSSQMTNKEFKVYLDDKPDGFPIPTEVTSSSVLYDHNGLFWRNLGIFYKQIEWYSVNPFKLKNYYDMIAPYKPGEDLLTSCVVFFPKEIIYSDSARFFSCDTVYTHHPDEVISYSEEKPFLHIQTFTPGDIVIQTNVNSPRMLVIMQNYYPGWKARSSDGTSLDITPVNDALIAVKVPAGLETIHLRYHRPDLIIVFLVMIMSWMGICLYFLVRRKSLASSEKGIAS
ncbi:YfhO family protein [Bacteroidales bacterium OttesenSCG-928-L19]|nr:YfhO family protein [Bacteroidales bacterium OttesenSCG-928-L19]